MPGSIYEQLFVSLNCTKCEEINEVTVDSLRLGNAICSSCAHPLSFDRDNLYQLTGKYRQFHRLLISYNDFKQVILTANYILEEQLPEKRQELRGEERSKARIAWEGLNCAMIVAYARPFSGNDRGAAVPLGDLPQSVLQVLNDEELTVHKAAIEDRNTLLAHSDSDAWDLDTTLYKVGGTEILLPVHTDARAPLTREATEILLSAANKLQEEVFRRRQLLETELKDHLKVVEYTDEEVKELRKQHCKARPPKSI